MINFLRRTCYNGGKIFIWGAGDNGRKIMTALSLTGVIIEGFFDNAYPNGGTVVSEGEIYPISMLYNYSSNDVTIIVSCSMWKEIVNQIKQIGDFRIIIKDEISMYYNEKYNKLSFPYENNPEVSVCLTAYNNWNMTYNCLKSLGENQNECSYEVILGDNNSTDETSKADAYLENVNIIHHEKNLQYLGNANEIVSRAKGEYIFLLANDVLFTKKRYIDTLLDYVRSDESIGMISGRLWVPSRNKYDVHFIYERIDKTVEIELNRPQNVENMWPVATMIPKRVWDEIGGYDPVYLPVYYEDVDLEMRIINRGYDIVAVPDAEVIHYCGVTYQLDESNDQVKRNKRIFRDRWNRYLMDINSRKEYLNRR